LVLKVANARLEVIGGPYLDREKVIVILLELLAGGVFCEEQLGEALEVVDRAPRKRVELVGDYSLQDEGKIQQKMESFLA